MIEENEKPVRAFYEATVLGHRESLRGLQAPHVVYDLPEGFPAQLRLNHWALSGYWTMNKEAAVLNKASGRIAYRFHARDLHLVMGPAARGTSVRLRVLIDEEPPGAAHGIDVDAKGNGTVTEQRLSADPTT